MNIEERAKKIRLVCTDVDGVLTDGALHYGPDGGHWKSFYVRDGTGIKALQRAGIPVAFVSGLISNATMLRAKDLGIEDCFMGNADKISIIQSLCAKYGVAKDEVAHIGDDLIDLRALGFVGMAVCPQDAVPEVRLQADWVAPVDGGRGVIRAVAELILKSKGLWDEVVDSYRTIAKVD
jgi:3-deoxy-D-manno-octulosonate 8-phosphate phosphatase (KDO 8-P phosphatase)